MDSIAGLESSLLSAPDDIRLRLKLGDLFFRAGRTKEACTHFTVVAESYSRDGFLLKAVAVYRRIIKLEPGHRGSYDRLAALYSALGLPEDATEADRKASLLTNTPAPQIIECSFCRSLTNFDALLESKAEPSTTICLACLQEAAAFLV